ncbi:MAG TPA: DUF21 domain-containing protein [Candidatus Ornithomonoglobus merdipullorum]|uniref:DUF21 domain-containing protein n=1 Tax=Candidatus Ornithomonoglobus merdipullorum TaxID=2840895 RepID=A0A9D1SEB7_9FIRM|nr:DUF21 domain-containing protein [Candidatus Ornithomonoglobus merdipullorum]
MPLQILLQVILIALNAVFASAEIAVISFNDIKLQKAADDGDKRAKKLVKLTAEPTNFLGTIQVGITLAGFLGSAFAADNFSGVLVGLLMKTGIAIPESVLNSIAVVIITIILSLVTLIFGELVPKRVAMKKAESLSLALSGLLYGVAKVCRPIVWFLTKSTNGVLRLCGINPHVEEEEVTEEQIRMMLDVGSEKGTIDPEEKTMIHNIFELDDTPLDDVMTHRRDLKILWIEDDVSEWEKTIEEEPHRKYLVCSESVDNVKGVMDIRKFYKALYKGQNVKSKIEPAYFVPETMNADELFRKMQKLRRHFAVVLDEYGGLSGVVTMSSLLEEIVGSLKLSDEPEEIVKISDNLWRMDGSVSLDEVSEALDIQLSDDEYSTLAGLILNELNEFPADGTTPLVETCGLRLQVTDIHDRRIESVNVSKIMQEPESEDEDKDSDRKNKKSDRKSENADQD